MLAGGASGCCWSRGFRGGTPVVHGGIQPGRKASAVNCRQNQLETESELSMRTNILKMI